MGRLASPTPSLQKASQDQATGCVGRESVTQCGAVAMGAAPQQPPMDRYKQSFSNCCRMERRK
ncbi:hypothetical protein EYF80_008059 [Liparis tanakae]|uniref:Uncharacterized protein n=1 Tax=Liparis tanakae TaxID=230148 RepID=A0A4Z2IWH6_9TELE|nr:hypothetical protein EYF80_008059 [Liparis tanakae]